MRKKTNQNEKTRLRMQRYRANPDKISFQRVVTRDEYRALEEFLAGLRDVKARQLMPGP